MRYRPEHKEEIRQKIVKDAAQRVRKEGIAGAPVSAVMRDAGLTHGGFYKHFESKDELLLESLHEAFQETADRLVAAAKKSLPAAAWKTIVKVYLSQEHCDHAEHGCPLAALGPELMRVDASIKSYVREEMARYRERLTPFMPGRRAAERERNFLVIFSTMIGAVEMARMLPDEAARMRVLGAARDFLLKSF